MDTIDALLVLQRSDLSWLTAQREALGTTRLLFLDPGTLDAAVSANLGNFELRRLDLPQDMPAEVYREALDLASVLDRELTAERRALWAHGDAESVPFTGWDQMLLYLSLQRALTARALGQAVARQWPEQRLGLLRPQPAQWMHFDSMLCTEMAAVDPQRFRVVGHYETVRYWNPQMVTLAWHGPALTQQVKAMERVEAVAHIATCFYDAEAFAGAIRGRFPRLLDLPATYCDVPVARQGAALTPMDELPLSMVDPSVWRYEARARAVFERVLAGLVPGRAALQQQAAAWATRCRQQALNYLTLRQVLKGQRPHVVVADHDSGMNGPIYSVAAELGSPITVLPHSGYCTSALPHARGVQAVELPGYAAPVRSLLGQPVPTRAVPFRGLPPPPPMREHPRSVCLLLNTMQSEGISPIDFFALVVFFKRLQALCDSRHVTLSVRLKPSAQALSVVASAFGQPASWFQRTAQMALTEVARETDLVVAYGEMTSGAAYFLDAGSLVLHASEQRWPADPLITPPFLHDGLVASQSGEEALADLVALLGDPGLYQQRRKAQALAYERRKQALASTFFD